MAHDDTYGWLNPALVNKWLKAKSPEADKAAVIEQCRLAAADWIEDQRRDLISTEVADLGEFKATPRIVQAGLLSVSRLVARMDSPNGVVAFAELGAGSILARDPDVIRMLGRNRKVVLG